MTPKQKAEKKGTCVICGGNIIEKVVTEFDPETGPPIIGPGSRSQFRRVSKGFYCQRCGLKYEFPTPSDLALKIG